MFEAHGADSVISVTEALVPLQWYLRVDEQGVLQSFLGEDDALSNRQAYEEAYVPNGAVYVFRTAVLRSTRQYYTSKTWPFFMPRGRSVDIDGLLVEAGGLYFHRSVAKDLLNLLPGSGCGPKASVFAGNWRPACAGTSLKWGAGASDGKGMFRPTSEPLLLSQASLHGFCPSLNTPVVQLEGLPVAPARAAIVLHDAGYGELCLALGVASTDSGKSLVYVYQEPLDFDTTPEQAIDIALHFAEGMGFLFDDDLLSSGEGEGGVTALERWSELMGAAATPAPSDFDESEFDESELEEPPDLETDADLADELPAAFSELLADPAPTPGDPPGEARGAEDRARDSSSQVTLSKFRGPVERPSAETQTLSELDAADAPAEQPGGASKLGRVAIVRKRQPKGEGPSALLRLLGSF